MWRFLQFLSRFGNFILLVLLEVVAFMIIVSLNKEHREISQGLFLEMSGSVGELQTSVVGYFNLSTENEKLLARTAILEADIDRLRDSIDALTFGYPRHAGFMLLPDSVRKDSILMAKFLTPGVQDSAEAREAFRFIPCRAVNNTVRLNYNYITLDKGRRHGVRTDMGVISPDGIAGHVIGVSENFALALSVLNRKFRLSAEILHNNNVGTLNWDGGSADLATLDFIPQTSRIKKGDTVVTTGYGKVFPSNYLIGTVEDYNTDEQDGFYHIDVKLATNFNALHHLFLVDFQLHEEMATLDTLKSEQ
jgi:rod shape-determining protein MreC